MRRAGTWLTITRVGLVQKFVEIESWTPARKTLFLAGALATPALVLNLVVAHVILRDLDWFDMRWYDVVLAVFLAGSTASALASWWAVRRGAEGRWTYYAFGIPYALSSALVVYVFGVNSTPLFALLPLAAVIVIVWYDDQIGTFVTWFVLACIVALEVTTATGSLRYAPMVEDARIADEGSLAFTLTLSYLVLVLVVVTLLSVRVVVLAARQNAARLRETHAQLERATAVIARYVPAELADDILSGEAGGDGGHARRKLTVFFSDIVGFTDIAEELEPEDLALVLNDYFSEMTAIAQRHHGTVDELQGDALLILFGAPRHTSDREHACSAVRMAAEMHAALDVLNERWREAGITEVLAVRMGINTGVVTIGHFGSPSRMKYAALGKHVNIAARLQAICTPGRTVISYATWLLVKDEVEGRALGPQVLKGIHRPVDAYELTGLT